MAFDGEILDFVESDLIEVDLSTTEEGTFPDNETTVHVQLGLDTTGASEGDAITIVSGVPAWAPNPDPEVTQAELDAVESEVTALTATVARNKSDAEMFAWYVGLN